jgi:hypothetical protein
MIRVLSLLLLAILCQWGCAEMPSDSSSSVVNRAALCATCGATVSGDYFFDTTNRAMGPTNR